MELVGMLGRGPGGLGCVLDEFQMFFMVLNRFGPGVFAPATLGAQVRLRFCVSLVASAILEAWELARFCGSLHAGAKAASAVP